MTDYCENCGSDPCICDSGFSIKEPDAIDEVLDDEEIGVADELIEPALVDLDPLSSEEKKDFDYFDDDEDDGIDLPYTDED